MKLFKPVAFPSVLMSLICSISFAGPNFSRPQVQTSQSANSKTEHPCSPTNHFTDIEDLNGAVKELIASKRFEETGNAEWSKHLDIQLTNAEILDAYGKYGSIPLRQLKHKKLIIGCGNGKRERSFEKSYMCIRSHKDADTINVDPENNPTIIGSFQTPEVNTKSHFIPNNNYEEIISEVGFGFDNITEVERILKPGGSYFSYGSSSNVKNVDSLPKNLKILVIQGHIGAIKSKEDAEKASKWWPFEEAPFRDQIDKVSDFSFSAIIAKQRDDGSFPTEAPEFMLNYIPNSWTETE